MLAGVVRLFNYYTMLNAGVSFGRCHFVQFNAKRQEIE